MAAELTVPDVGLRADVLEVARNTSFAFYLVPNSTIKFSPGYTHFFYKHHDASRFTLFFPIFDKHFSPYGKIS